MASVINKLVPFPPVEVTFSGTERTLVSEVPATEHSVYTGIVRCYWETLGNCPGTTATTRVRGVTLFASMLIGFRCTVGRSAPGLVQPVSGVRYFYSTTLDPFPVASHQNHVASRRAADTPVALQTGYADALNGTRRRR